MIDSSLQSVNKISGNNKKISQIDKRIKISGINKKIAQIDKRIQTYDKVTTYPYGTNAFKVCEMLSKNKLNRLDENKNMPKDKDKTNSKCKDKNKTKSKCKDENKLIMIYSNEKMEVIKGNDWILRKILLVFWDYNNHISELREKWAFCSDNYVSTRFEELRTRSGEALYTRENKATLSKKKK